MSIGYGEFIKKHRIASGYKRQKLLAQKTGITSPTLSRIENEKQKPLVTTLQTLAEYLPTTSLGELMKICDYTDQDSVEDSNVIIELRDLHLFRKYTLQIDGQTLSIEELRSVVAVVKALRKSS